MTTLTQPLNWFIKEQVDLGIVKSEVEAEIIIINEIRERELDRKILLSKEQIKNWNYVEFNKSFVDWFLNESKNKLINK